MVQVGDCVTTRTGNYGVVQEQRVPGSWWALFLKTAWGSRDFERLHFKQSNAKVVIPKEYT